MALAHSRSLFPGAMGPDGFISCFDHLIPPDQLRRKLILKGGPGVGKSTFMRRIHAALCTGGAETTLYFCSGDPDSLDAVAMPESGLLVLDGTAPHVVDPQYLGARDSIINLGEYLNEAAMRPRLAQIRSVIQEHAACMRRARACMRAAVPLLRDNAAIIDDASDSRQIARITHALIQSTLDGAPSQPKASFVRPIITDAITAKGELSLLAENAQPRVIHLTGHRAMDFTPVLRSLSHGAQAKGFSVEEHLNPRLPGSLLHITIPALQTLVTTSDRLPSEQTFDFSACLAQGSLLRHECALEQSTAAIAQHMRRAIDALKDAKELHDELETFYVPNMDFAAWQKKLNETIASLS